MYCRCRRWVAAVGVEDLAHILPQQLHNDRRVCAIHFLKEDICYGAKFTRLKKEAIPTLCLPPPLSEAFLDTTVHANGRYCMDRVDPGLSFLLNPVIINVVERVKVLFLFD